MCIIAQDGNSYARLRFNTGPGGEVKIPVYVDYDCEFAGSDLDLWIQQYKTNVFVDEILKEPIKSEKTVSEKQTLNDLPLKESRSFSLLTSDDLIAEVDRLDPVERQLFMDELAVRNDFWSQEDEVLYG